MPNSAHGTKGSSNALTARGYASVGRRALEVIVISLVSCGRSPANSFTVTEPTLVWRSGGTAAIGDVVLGAPSDGALGPSGDAAVVDRFGVEVILLDSVGRLKTTLGSQGAGPGEFLSPAKVGFQDDSAIWVSDAANGRITMFGRDGKVVRTFARAWEPIAGSPWSVEGAWLLHDNTVLGYPNAPPDPHGRAVSPIPLALWTSDAERLKVVTWIQTEAPSALQIPTSMGTFRGTRQFIAGTPIIGADGSGKWFFVVDRTPSTTDIGEIHITRYGVTGNRLGEVAIPYKAKRVNGDVWTFIQGRAEAYEIQSVRARAKVKARDVVDAVWVPEYLPPVRGAFADTEGFWLERERNYPRLSDGVSLWERYDLGGHLTGATALPGPFHGLAAARRRILGWYPDSMGVPILELYNVNFKE